MYFIYLFRFDLSWGSEVSYSLGSCEGGERKERPLSSSGGLVTAGNDEAHVTRREILSLFKSKP